MGMNDHFYQFSRNCKFSPRTMSHLHATVAPPITKSLSSSIFSPFSSFMDMNSLPLLCFPLPTEKKKKKQKYLRFPTSLFSSSSTTLLPGWPNPENNQENKNKPRSLPKYSKKLNRFKTF